MKENLRTFYAVTVNDKSKSLYEVSVSEMGSATLKKLDGSDNATIPIGTVLDTGPMLSVGKQLIIFVPEGGGGTSYQREIAMVNTGYWGRNTSPVAALFLVKEEAERCFESEELSFAAPLWKENTVATLRAIGNEHPQFSISKYSSLELLPSEDWMETVGSDTH